jgi:hypothetical protein
VTIEYLTTVDEPGFPTETWATLVGVEFMSRLDLRADERYANHQESAYAETSWQMAYRPDMDPELVDVPASRRLVWQGRTYDIVTASLIGERVGIECLTLSKPA